MVVVLQLFCQTMFVFVCALISVRNMWNHSGWNCILVADMPCNYVVFIDHLHFFDHPAMKYEKALLNSYQHLIILGDFNSDPGVNSRSFMERFHLHELVQCPTRVTATTWILFLQIVHLIFRLLLLFLVALVIIIMFSLIFVLMVSLSVPIIKLFLFVNTINLILHC